MVSQFDHKPTTQVMCPRCFSYYYTVKKGRKCKPHHCTGFFKGTKDTGLGIMDAVQQALAKPVIADVILVGVTDAEGIRQMKEEGFVPLGWDGDAVIDEELHHGTKEDHEDRQAGGSEDETQG